MKKILYIGAALVAVLAIAAFWYFNRQAAPPAGSVKAPNVPAAPSTAPTAAGRLKTLSSKPAISYWVSDDSVYYLSEAGKIAKISLADGKEEEVFSQPLYDVAAVKPSPDGKEAIVGFGRPPVFSRFTVKDKSWQPLPNDVLSAGWLGQKIVLVKKTSEAGAMSLTLYDPEKKTETKITTLNVLDAGVVGGEGNKIIVATSPTLFYESVILAIDAVKKTVELFAAPAKGLTVGFSGAGGRGLIYKKPSVAAVELSGKVLGVLPFTTLPSKCGWQSETSLICAAVTNLEKQALPDDYLKGFFYSSDEFYRVTLGETVSSEKIFSPEQLVDADSVSALGDKVFFINRRTSRLYSLEL